MNFIDVKGTINNNPVKKNVSQLILGSADFTPDNTDEVSQILDTYLELGGNTIDTAHQYVGSEEALGKWLKVKNNREKIQVLTKGAHPDDGEPGNRVAPPYIEKDLHESLERLQTEYVDFFALHRDDPSVEVGIILETLNKFIEDGKIHSIGASNWKKERLEEANDYAAANGLIGFSFSSPNLSLAKCNEPRWPGCISMDEGDIEWHSKTNIPVFSWSSQAGGFFSGRFKEEDRSNEEMVRVYYSSNNWKRYQRAVILSEEKNVSPIQISLAYVLNQSFPTSAIIGPKNKEELYSSVEGMQINLTKSEMEWLDLIND